MTFSNKLPISLGGRLLLLLAAATFPACSGSTSNNGSGGSNSSSTGPDTVLQEMIKAYQRADSYADEALLRVTYRFNGEDQEEASTQSVKFKRPNQLTLHVEQEYFTADVICDGTTLVAQVKEPDTRNMGNQMVVVPAPERLRMHDIEADQVLFRNYITRVLNVAPVQLELLVESKPLSWAFARRISRKLLDDAEIDGHACHRVWVDAGTAQPTDGHFVFWVDKESHLLRRLEYPLGDLEEQFEDARLFVDYNQAAFNAQLNDRDFRFEVPSDAVQVRFFVPPVATPPLALELYGSRPDFKLIDAEGGEVTPKTLAGKNVVLAWFDDTPGSEEMLRQLGEFRATHQDDAALEVFAVGVKSYKGEDPAELLRAWNSKLPLLIDSDLHEQLKIVGVPILVVLDGTGAIQYAELGVNPDVTKTLTGVLDRLKRGDDVAAAERKQLQLDLDRYHQAIQTAQSEGPSVVFERPEVEILPARDPEHLKLTPAWTNSEFKEAAGNLLPIQTADGWRLLAFDGFRTVAELDEHGKTVARHELPIGQNAAVSYLRTAVDKAGRRWYAASFRMGTEAFVFDERWKLAFKFPPGKDNQDSIRDVQLADLGDDGEPELLVGYWGQAGVHGVALNGERTSWNRVFPSVFSLAVSQTNPTTGWRKLLVTGSTGGILELNQFLRHDSPYMIANPDPRGELERHVQSIYTAQYEGGDVRYCGIAETTEGKTIALGLAEGPQHRLEELWSYGLPDGLLTQVEAVTSGRLIDTPGGQWLFAGADGSLHLISQDAKFNDYWRLGKPISGMAIAQLGDRPAILISSGNEVTARYVEPLLAP